MYEASQIDCSKDSVTNMKILFEMCPFSLTKTVLFYVRHVIFASRFVRKRIVNLKLWTHILSIQQILHAYFGIQKFINLLIIFSPLIFLKRYFINYILYRPSNNFFEKEDLELEYNTYPKSIENNLLSTLQKIKIYKIVIFSQGYIYQKKPQKDRPSNIFERKRNVDTTSLLHPKKEF